VKTNFPEKFIYHIWDAQHIRYRDQSDKTLKTVSGRELRIHFAGHFNTMSGADFRNATIEIDGENFEGDIEIHINSSDWYQHGHDENPAYNNVILHVVYNHNHHIDRTILEDSAMIEILEIQDLFTSEIQILFAEYTECDFRQKEKFCRLFSTIRPEFFTDFLHSCGLARLEKKKQRFSAELSFVSIDQLFYQSLFEALGYARNKVPFYLFAKDHGWIYYRNLYISSSGMTIDDFVESLVSNAGFESMPHNYDWYMFRIRPQNHPLTRIYQIAPFLYSSFETSLTTTIQSLFSYKKDEFNIKIFKKRLYNTLCVDNKYTKYNLGRERINTIVVNIFLPILLVYAELTADTELNSLCRLIYTEFDPLSENHTTNIMRNYMTDTQYALSQSKAIYQQGLLHIYHKYCANHLCELCVRLVDSC
jgi:hypothetical protein